MVDKKRALVIGGTRGIGHAIVDRFVRGGYEVDFTGTEIGSISLSRDSSEATAYSLDLGNPVAVEEFSTKYRRNRKQIKAIVCNAGMIRGSKGWPNSTQESWQRVFQVNLFSYGVLLQDLRDVLTEMSSITLIGSVYGRIGAAPVLEYAAAKFALESVARSLVPTLSPRTRVNVVIPGNIDTEMTRGAGAEIIKEVVRRTPLGRLGEPQEVAEAVYFLASDKASFITGASLSLDGGFT